MNEKTFRSGDGQTLTEAFKAKIDKSSDLIGLAKTVHRIAELQFISEKDREELIDSIFEALDKQKGGSK